MFFKKVWKYINKTIFAINVTSFSFSFFSGVLLRDLRIERVLSFSSSFSWSISVKLWASAKLSTAIAKKTFNRMSAGQRLRSKIVYVHRMPKVICIALILFWTNNYDIWFSKSIWRKTFANVIQNLWLWIDH